MYFISFKGLIESKLSIISILSLTSTNNNGSPIKEDNSKKNSNNNLIEEMNNVDNQYSPNKDLFDII